MHYFGVYALARAAGMKAVAAEVVATASQYVDDAIEAGSIEIEISSQGILDYIQDKAAAFWEEIVSFGLSQAFPLGHAAAATYPDRPYLRWQYTRAGDGNRIERDNPKDFVNGCK